MKIVCPLLLALLAAGAAYAADPAPVDAGWLVAELRKGGYLVFFRHTTTFRDQATMEMEARNVRADACRSMTARRSATSTSAA